MINHDNLKTWTAPHQNRKCFKNPNRTVPGPRNLQNLAPHRSTTNKSEKSHQILPTAAWIPGWMVINLSYKSTYLTIKVAEKKTSNFLKMRLMVSTRRIRNALMPKKIMIDMIPNTNIHLTMHVTIKIVWIKFDLAALIWVILVSLKKQVFQRWSMKWCNSFRSIRNNKWWV